MQKKSLETILYSTAGVVVMLVILIAFNFIAGTARSRLDLTQEKAYTLSAGTRGHPEEARYARNDPLLLHAERERHAGDRVSQRAMRARSKTCSPSTSRWPAASSGSRNIDPQPDSDAEDSARLDGLEAAALARRRPVLSGPRRQVRGPGPVHCASWRPTANGCWNTTWTGPSSASRTPEKPTIGLMSPLPVFGMPSNPMMQQMGQQGSQPWTIVTELKNDFDVKRVGMDVDKIDDDIKLLLVIAPKDISDKAQYAIDQFIMRGGKLVAFLDAQCLADNRQQNQMMAQHGRRRVLARQAPQGLGHSVRHAPKSWPT